MDAMRSLTTAVILAVQLTQLPVFAAETAGPEIDRSEGSLRTVRREEVFQFAREPQASRTGDGTYEIAFAVKARCDVAVAIEDAEGRMVRHLAYGVLGANAPEPFRKDSLDQKLVWDGRDDAGRKVDRPGQCRVRVSLGLDPTFDRVFHGHDKDYSADACVDGLAADKDGVYVLFYGFVLPSLRMYDHGARYVRTLLPVRGDKLGSPELGIRTQTTFGRLVPERASLPGFCRVRRHGTGGHPDKLAAGGGWVVTLSDRAELLRLKTDGTTGGTPFPGPAIPVAGQMKDRPVEASWTRLALSPDGQWLYVMGLRPQPRKDGSPADAYDRAVWRVRRDALGTIGEEKPLIGQVAEGTSDAARGLVQAQGIACDAQGRVYVCDVALNRVQVYGPDGAHLKSLPVDRPREVDVHRKTGEIYVLCEGKGRDAKEAACQKEWRFGCTGKGAIVLRKFRGLEDAKPLLEQEFPAESASPYAPQVGVWFIPAMCVDSWTEPTTVWLVHRNPSVSVYADRGAKLELVNDFEREVRAAGMEPYAMGEALNTERLAVDPLRGHLYYSRWSLRCRWDEPAGAGKPLKLDLRPGFRFTTYGQEICDLGFSSDGMLHVLTDVAGTVRFDPSKARLEERQGESRLLFPADAIAPFRESAGKPSTLAGKEIRLQGVLDTAFACAHSGGWCVAPDGGVVGVVRKDPHDPGQLTRWDRDGRMVAKDVLSLGKPYQMRGIRGLQTDAAGSLYVGWGFSSSTSGGQASVAKFLAGAAYSKTNMLWSVPGFASVVDRGCQCWCAEFETDPYGRTFVPRAVACTVAVVDSNGNRICEIGKYGNADTRGPKDSTVKISGQEIGLAWCWNVAARSDRWLYLLDNGNNRILRVKLGYQEEKRIPLP